MLSLLLTTAIVSLNSQNLVSQLMPSGNAGEKIEMQVAQEPAPEPELVRQFDYTVQYKDCERIADEQVRCTFRVRNDDPNRRDIGIGGATLFDANGGATKYSSVNFTGQSWSMSIPSQVPVEGVAVFSGVPRTTPLVFLELELISYYSPTTQTFVAGFRL